MWYFIWIFVGQRMALPDADAFTSPRNRTMSRGCQNYKPLTIISLFIILSLSICNLLFKIYLFFVNLMRVGELLPLSQPSNWVCVWIVSGFDHIAVGIHFWLDRRLPSADLTHSAGWGINICSVDYIIIFLPLYQRTVAMLNLSWITRYFSI